MRNAMPPFNAMVFTPAPAEAFAVKARRIAESLKLVLFFRPAALWPKDLRMRNLLAETAATR